MVNLSDVFALTENDASKYELSQSHLTVLLSLGIDLNACIALDSWLKKICPAVHPSICGTAFQKTQTI